VKYNIGDIVYRAGSPQSYGVVTDTRDEDAPHLWGGKLQFVKVTWKNPNTGNKHRVTNTTGPDEWISAMWLGGSLKYLAEQTERKARIHRNRLQEAIRWYRDEVIPRAAENND
jgi:hypothetical protein